MILFDALQPAELPTAIPIVAPPEAAVHVRTWLETPWIKAFLPIPVLCAVLPVVWWFFRATWRELDAEARRWRDENPGAIDPRPIAVFVLAAVVLTMQEYYGGRGTYDEVVRPFLARQEIVHHRAWIKLAKYDELYGYAWWAATRVLGYLVVPFPVYKALFRRDSLLDLGLRVRGLLRHLWIYGACLLVVVPLMLLVSRQPDFGAYYPFYKQCSRSWADLLAWEALYGLQFFALEAFFRGLWLGAMRRSLGSGAIFAMAVPYCMIHYGKPYLEANGAIVAGIVLGSLAMRTKSIYAGFLVHITVAFGMDFLALWHRKGLPVTLWAPG